MSSASSFRWCLARLAVATALCAGLVPVASAVAVPAERAGARRAGLIPLDTYEPDGTVAQASVIAPDETQNHSINPSTDEDWVAFRAIAGMQYTIETGPTGAGDVGDTALYLYEEDGTTSIDLSYDIDSGDYYSRIRYACSEDETLTVLAVSEFGQSGNYALSVQEEELTLVSGTVTTTTAEPFVQVAAFSWDEDAGMIVPGAMAGVEPDGTYDLIIDPDVPTCIIFATPAFIEFYDNWRYGGMIPNPATPDVEWFTAAEGEHITGIDCILGSAADMTVPTVASDAVESYVGTAAITINGTDNEGVEDVFYSIDGQEPVRVKSDSAVAEVAPPALGETEEHTLSYWVKDYSGNASAVDQVEFDITNPDTLGPIVTCDAVATYTVNAQITISASDPSGVASVSWRVDDGDWNVAEGDTAVAVIDAVGVHTLDYMAIDTVGNESEIESCQFEVLPLAGVFRIAGANRYATAIQASRAAFPAGAETVVLATGANWPDALGGSALAGVADAPLLLTGAESLSVDVAFEIVRLGASRAYILGGTGAVSSAIETQLATYMGADNVVRLAGTDRYATAKAIADEVVDLAGDAFGGGALVATGADYPDALGGSPMATANGMPVLLTNPVSGEVYVPESVSEAFILGGTAAVTASTEASLVADLGEENVVRCGGANRYETGALVASLAVEQGLRWNGVGITTGQDFPDALAAGAMLGARTAVMLMTPSDSLHPAVASALTENAGSIETAYIIGGTGAVSTAVEDAIKGLLE